MHTTQPTWGCLARLRRLLDAQHRSTKRTGMFPSEAVDESNNCCPQSADGRRLPVLFWIHPSAYAGTGALVYGYQGVAENFIPHDIIVVTIQHRLGPLGVFLLIGKCPSILSLGILVHGRQSASG